MTISKTYLFYDIETSGLNKCFDQVVQFACIRTDLALNELERHNIFVKLNPDVVPSPQAFLTHKISLEKLAQEGICEHEAMLKIHKLFNMYGTISIGYNTLGFDDEFLRWSFYRNFLHPYSHHSNNGCERRDIYPIAVMFYLFKQEVLIWKNGNNEQNEVSLKLENLSNANNLMPNVTSQAHCALHDVEATINLAKKFFKETPQWEYCHKLLQKKEDIETYTKKLSCIKIGDLDVPYSIFIDGSFGKKNNFQTVALSLGQHRHYKNQYIWLDLTKNDLTQSNANNIAETTWVHRKKFGEPPLMLPASSKFSKYLEDNHELVAKIKHNTQVLQQNPNLFHSIIDYHLEYKYPEVENLDLDASLYNKNIYEMPIKHLHETFSQLKTVAEKIKFLDKINDQDMRNLYWRLLGRNYLSQLPENFQHEFSAWLKQRENNDIRDYKNAPHLTFHQTLEEIQQLQDEFNKHSEENTESLKILSELKKYCELATNLYSKVHLH